MLFTLLEPSRDFLPRDGEGNEYHPPFGAGDAVAAKGNVLDR